MNAITAIDKLINELSQYLTSKINSIESKSIRRIMIIERP